MKFSSLKFLRIVFCLVLPLVLLAGCLGQKSPAEQIYDVMEKAVAAEKKFEEQQAPLVELEKKEKELFDQIVEIGQKEFDQVEKLSNDALKLVDKRKEHIALEKESLDESRKQFGAAADHLKEIKDPKLKEKAELVVATMKERYSAHEKLYKEYMIAIENDQKLYTLLKTKDVNLKVLEGQITSVNGSYTKVLEANKQFNELTEKYNQEKLSFFKLAGLEGKNES
ncbi:YkyA family protein [Bacillus sp. EB01]|uniref:YkyA family protein n=1 Tax=Bacillus sp. EB01 TaxID=1347086 RepID=UPI0005C738D1|nr:YkyA family protein [Bacillus sp. EB01]